MQPDQPKLIFAVVVGLLMLARGCGDTAPQPDPATAAQCFASYQALMAEAWAEGAAMDFASDREALEWIKAKEKNARVASFMPIHEREQAAFIEGWTDARNDAMWAQFARECQ